MGIPEQLLCNQDVLLTKLSEMKMSLCKQATRGKTYVRQQIYQRCYRSVNVLIPEEETYFLVQYLKLFW